MSFHGVGMDFFWNYTLPSFFAIEKAHREVGNSDLPCPTPTPLYNVTLQPRFLTKFHANY